DPDAETIGSGYVADAGRVGPVSVVAEPEIQIIRTGTGLRLDEKTEVNFIDACDGRELTGEVGLARAIDLHRLPAAVDGDVAGGVGHGGLFGHDGAGTAPRASPTVTGRALAGQTRATADVILEILIDHQRGRGRLAQSQTGDHADERTVQRGTKPDFIHFAVHDDECVSGLGWRAFRRIVGSDPPWGVCKNLSAATPHPAIKETWSVLTMAWTKPSIRGL